MLRSPAYRALSLSGHKILSRIEIELADHGGDKGRENGNLIVTYNNFEAYGMDRHAIGPAISEVVACKIACNNDPLKGCFRVQ
jgi:hypothetical protein